MTIPIATVEQHIKSGNKHFTRSKSSLAPVLTAIEAYNGRTGTVDAIARELVALRQEKRQRYQILVAWLEDLGELKAAVLLERGRARLQTNAFRTTASLANYSSYFGAAFQGLLDTMGADDVWLDAGAGEAVAMREYVEQRGSRPHARCIAVGYQKPESFALRAFEQNTATFSYVHGKFFGQMTDEELGVAPGALTLITDFNGVLFYTTELSQDLTRYAYLLGPGGVAFFGFHCDIFRDGDFRHDDRVELIDYFHEIAGARVDQHGNAYGTHFEMTRGHGDVHVPPLAYVPERSDPDWSPPVRTFVW